MDEFLVPLETPCVYHDANFLDPSDATEFYQDLLKNIPWEKTAKINRWVHLCQEKADGDSSAAEQLQPGYAYKDAPRAGLENNTQGYANPPFPETVQKVREACQEWYLKNKKNSTSDGGNSLPPSFNVCLLNFYQDGTQRIGWHSDREEIGRTTPIASVSLGTTRQFLIRSQSNGMHDRASLMLQHGSLIVMEPECQLQYLHSIAKEPQITEGRINLTFRCKNEGETTAGEEMHTERDNALDKITSGVEANANGWSTDTAGIGAAASIFGEDLSRSNELFRDTLEPNQVFFLAKTNLGAEKYTAAEIQEHLDAEKQHNGSMIPWQIIIRPFEIDGFVACCLPMEEMDTKESSDENDRRTKTIMLSQMQSILLKLRSVYHVIRYHHHFRLNDCRRNDGQDNDTEEMMIPKEALYEYVRKILLNGTLSFGTHDDKNNNKSTSEDAPAVTFRVTCERTGGPHSWQAPDVEYEIGGAISQVMEVHGWKVKMNDYDLCIRADVIGKYIVVGTQINVHDMTKGRFVLKYHNAVTIKSNLAYVMLRLGNLLPGNLLLDPFCGSGTIPMEALQMFQGKISVVGMDVSKKSANGAWANAEGNGYSEKDGIYTRCFVHADARGLRRQVEDDSVDAVVTNLPWGVMTGQHQSGDALQTLYEVFLRNSWYVLKPGGRVVLFVLRGLQMIRIIRKLSGRFNLLLVNVIRTSNNLPCIVVIEKLESDRVRDAIKGQLAHLNQFVSVSPEIFQSIHTEELEDD
ncbi:DNA-N1-methyladenine dioxygenase [Nitzschia inconspicua]|uniref:DNA-N1-methyladenine dioxygenase n=1 Tax=Nitzschia inconspicua TaxID=303405 RepID=A0A9K3M5Z2_9STRA|nr:DNA-N1-methyladenine dioxygenase [Nitzschia inconspicua]